MTPRTTLTHTRREPRGFALVVVLIVAAATLAIAVGVSSISLSSTLGTTRSEFGDQSAMIAEAGLERAAAYLKTYSGSDYDAALDPFGNVNCMGGSAAISYGAGANQPRFTESGVVQNVVYPSSGGPESKTYTLVPFAGGAYLVRFDDDFDDVIVQPSWDNYTNKPAVTNGCREGDPAWGNNPARDRNRAIWVNVVGIYPGTDPDKARYKSVMRKLHNYAGAASVDGVKVKGNIEVTGTGGIYGCSPIGSIKADGNFTGGGAGEGCACGESRADGVSGPWKHCTDPTYSAQCASVGCAPGQLKAEPTTVPTLNAVDAAGPDGNDWYIDWTRSCVFYIDQSKNSALWFWDAQATRGPLDPGTGKPALCSKLDGLELAAPWPPDPSKAGNMGTDILSSSSSDWAGCWTPLILNFTGGGGTACRWPHNNFASPPAAFGTERMTGPCSWAPDSGKTFTIKFGDTTTPANFTNYLTGMNAFLTAASYSAFPAGSVTQELSFRKPNWASECQVTYPPYPGPVAQTTMNCTTCNGTNRALYDSGGGSSTAWIKADTAAEISAVPAGVYIYPSDLSFSGSGPDHAGPLPNKPELGGYPLATLVTMGNFDFQTQTYTGFGQEKPERLFPSIITNGNFELRGNSNHRVAGTIMSLGNFTYRGTNASHHYGELRINGNFDLGGTGNWYWYYSNALQEPAPGGGGNPLIYRSRQ